MRILCVGNRYPPWSLGGYETTWAGAVAALRDRGHHVRVLTTRPDPADRIMSGSPPVGVHRDLRWYWSEHRFMHPGLRVCVELERANATVFAAHLAAFSPDVVMWWAMGGMSLSLLEQARRARLPALAVVGDEWVNYGPAVDGWSRRWRGAGRVGGPAGRIVGPTGRIVGAVLERVVGVPTRLRLDLAGQWSFNSRYTLATARGAGWRFADASVDHPGVAPERFDAVPAGSGWGWRLLCCGRIDPRKGVETAVHALALLPAEARLTVHGDGDDGHLSELKALAQRIGVGDRVIFSSGAPDQVAGVYEHCDALLFAVTWREPWGLVPLEAMAAGRPVVASRAGGGAAEYLEPDGNCLGFAPGQAAELADAVKRLAAAPQLRGRLVAAGRLTAGRFTDHAFHAVLERRLEQALSRGPLA